MDNNFGILNNATSWLIDHKRRVFVNITSVAMLLIICMVLGAFDFMTATFMLEKLTQLKYWSHIFARIVSLICALNIGINIYQPIAESRNLLMQRDAIRYDGLIGLKEQKSFEHYVSEDFNPAEKKKAWVAHINKRIHRLGKLYKDRERMLWGLSEEKLAENPMLAEKKKHSKYCQKRAVLEEMKTEEWMDENIDALNVRSFHAVDPTIFDLSITGKEKYSAYKIVARPTLARGQKTATSIMTMTMVSMMITAWGFDINEAMVIDGVIGWLSATINAILDVAFVLWQFIRGIMYAPQLVEDELHTTYVDRIRILVYYFTSTYTPVNNFAQADKEITDHANTIVNQVQEELKKAKEDKDMAKLMKLQDDASTRIHNDSFGGRI